MATATTSEGERKDEVAVPPYAGDIKEIATAENPDGTISDLAVVVVTKL